MDLTITYTGYQSRRLRFYLDKDTTLNLALQPQEMLQEVVVTSESNAAQEVHMSQIDVPITNIKAMPALLGEVDVLKVLQLMPGVHSGTEGSSGIYVRGGGPDQNLILLDGVPVYNASHLFGFFSVFNADALNHVELFKGGFPARYGGRLSSVIDMRMKEGNKQEWHGEGGVGIIASRLTVEGPLKKNKSSILLSGRRTYIDVLTRPIAKIATQGDVVAGYYFYDLNGKVNYDFSNKNRLYLIAYTGSDRFYSRYKGEGGSSWGGYKEEAGLNWGNITTALRWNHVFSPRLFSNSTLTYSRYRFNIFSKYEEEGTNGQDDLKQEAKYYSGIEDITAKLEFDFVPRPDHYLRFGVNLTQHHFTPGAIESNNISLEDLNVVSQETNATEFYAFAEDDFKVSDRLKINGGLHFSGFRVEGETFLSLQPRLSSRYLIRHDLSLKASYVRMTQYIHLLTNSGIGLPTDLWVPATPRVRPQQAHQVAMGVTKLWKHDYELSVEGYYKTMNNLMEYKEGSSFVEMDKSWQDRVTSGTGESYGAEVYLQKKSGKTHGWLGYTLSWTNRQFDELNQGKPFPYRYDRRHDISLALMHQLTKRKELSATFVYGTGMAITIPVARIAPFLQDQLDNPDRDHQGFWHFNELRVYSDRNEYRMPAYHRMDLSYRTTKQTKWGERSWVFSVYNVYNRRNPFYIDLGYERNSNDLNFIQYSLFQIIPSISYNFKF